MKKDWPVKTLTYLNYICVIWTVLSIGYSLLIYFNAWPGCYYRCIKKNTINPIIYLYPGNKLRLDFDFLDETEKIEVKKVQWDISKNNEIIFNSDQPTPIFNLPTREGGIYSLNVKVTTNDNENRNGKINLHVTTDKSNTVKIEKPSTIKLTKENAGPIFHKLLSGEIELYTENEQWKILKVTNDHPDIITIHLPSNTNISTFENQILFRVKDSPKELTEYGSADIQIIKEQ